MTKLKKFLILNKVSFCWIRLYFLTYYLIKLEKPKYLKLNLFGRAKKSLTFGAKFFITFLKILKADFDSFDRSKRSWAFNTQFFIIFLEKLKSNKNFDLFGRIERS